MARKMIETRKRGFFGWVFIVVFWLWNALMAASLLIGLGGNASQHQMLATEAERAGHAIGTGLGLMFILVIWVCGAVIFGLLAFFTRGKRVLTEVEG